MPERGAQGPGGFYAALPVFDSFARVTDASLYAPLPEDWWLGVADVVRSTSAIAAGRYRAVNMAGACVISGVANALEGRDFPFAFGGDGASFAVGPEHRAQAVSALEAAAAFVRDDLGLELRVGMIAVAEIRARGLDVRVARYAPSPSVSYAMFSGGGLAYAEQRLKAGDIALAPAPPGTKPDLTGLSCRWDEVAPRRGTVLSLIVVPAKGAEARAYGTLVERLLALTEADAGAGHPLHEGGLRVGWPPGGFALEARAGRAPGESSLGRRLRLAARTLASFAILRLGIRIGGFDPALYRRDIVDNADFRKFDDGLRMTLDCTPDRADEIEALLAAAAKEGIVRYGTHRQGAALVTCLAPSPLLRNHVHFVDGAAGGYAAAASALKASFERA